MRLLGAAAVFAAALYAVALHRQRMLCTLRLGRALADDLTILRNGICIYRRTLPSICEEDLANSLASKCLWEVFLKYLLKGDLSAKNCWDRSIADLPEELAERLAPLGSLLSSGGDSLDGAIAEVREEILNDLRGRERELSVSMRLAAAVYLSGACVLVLVLA